jgi:hypothetical protein
MPVQSPDEVLRRLCLAYPWSPECQGVDPIRPTDSENGALWHGTSGYEYATGRNIPSGAQCESVQLIPLDKIGPRYPPPSPVPATQDSGQIYLQVPMSKTLQSFDMHAVIFPSLIWNNRTRLINNFI